MTALYFSVLKPEDRVAVKPHASPVFHAIQYLFGHQTRDKLERFRGFGGAQSYPSRTKDIDDVDFSTGSVGLGVAMTLFASLVQDYVRLKNLADDQRPTGRMVALARDLNQYPGIRRILEQHDDAALHRLITNLAGHDMQAVLDAFESVEDDRPTCFIAYTIKGQGLPFAGHKDNHSGLMTLDQMAGFKKGMAIADGQEWDKFAGLAAQAGELQAFIDPAPFNTEGHRRTEAPVVAIPPALPRPTDR